MRKEIERAIENSINVKKALLDDQHINIIISIAEKIIASYNKGGKVIVFGNGGSAADAQHMVCELVGRFNKERKGLPAISLTTNTSILTAISNDYAFDQSFKRQLEALAGPNDIAIGISTSGNASNVNEAIKKAKELNIKTIALTGKNGGQLSKEADISLIVPSDHTPCIQEAHILVIHIICGLVEDAIGK